MSVDLRAAIMAKRPKLKTSTLNNYISMIATVKGEAKNNQPLVDFLGNIGAVSALVDSMYPNLGTRTNVYTAIHAAADAVGVPIDTVDEYKVLMKSFASQRDTLMKQNKPREKLDKAGVVVIPWKELVAKVRLVRTFDRQHALLAMLTLIPPRRLEYRFLRFYAKAPITPEPSGLKDTKPSSKALEQRVDDAGVAWNYLHATDGGDGMRMVLRSHKVDAKHGVYAADLPDDLVNVLKQYFAKNKVEDGGDVFVQPRAKTPYSQSAFSKLVGDALKSYSGITNVTLGVDDLRHSIITNSRADPRTTTQDKEDLARQMGHGLLIAELAYNKLSAVAIAKAMRNFPGLSSLVSQPSNQGSVGSVGNQAGGSGSARAVSSRPPPPTAADVAGPSSRTPVMAKLDSLVEELRNIKRRIGQIEVDVERVRKSV